jgi:hypothetical protein
MPPPRSRRQASGRPACTNGSGLLAWHEPTIPAQSAAPLGSARSFGAGSTGGTMFWTRPGASVGVGVRRRSPFWGRPVDTAEPTMLLGGDSYRLVGRTSLGLRAALRSGLPRPGWWRVAAHSCGRSAGRNLERWSVKAGLCSRRSSNASTCTHGRANSKLLSRRIPSDRSGLAAYLRIPPLQLNVRDREKAGRCGRLVFLRPSAPRGAWNTWVTRGTSRAV